MDVLILKQMPSKGYEREMNAVKPAKKIQLNCVGL